MKTFPKKRLEFLVEMPFLDRLLTQLDDMAVNYTALPALAGSGSSGPWRRDGLVSEAGVVVMVVCILEADKADQVLEAVSPALFRQIGVVSISDVQVLRGDHF